MFVERIYHPAPGGLPVSMVSSCISILEVKKNKNKNPLLCGKHALRNVVFLHVSGTASQLSDNQHFPSGQQLSGTQLPAILEKAQAAVFLR